jgi:hypothetical protein
MGAMFPEEQRFLFRCQGPVIVTALFMSLVINVFWNIKPNIF